MIALLIRDLRLATRAGGGFGLGVAFFLILSALVPFGVGPDRATLAPVAPGILWVGALLACLLSLDRIFALDHEDGSLDLLATARAAADAVCLMLLQNVHGADGAVLHHHLHAQDAAVAIRLTRARVGAGAAGRKQNGAGTQ